MSGSKFECQKFSPNIFNKSKCQHCFRSKDQHSSEALESNRASRKISKCGYLFVAPDWDFSVPLNRTKRWQRRWFVMYEDGELTYSVDEHPDTIPQAIIDMTKVIEVSDAEDVTGNKFSLGITTPDKVHFIKGTCKEESKWWFDVLVIYPRNVKGRTKRNGTFPCIKSMSTNVNQSDLKLGNGQDTTLNSSRTRFHSCRMESGVSLDVDEPLRDSTSSALNTPKSVDRTQHEDMVNISDQTFKDAVKRDTEIVYGDENAGRSRMDVHHFRRNQRREGKKPFHSQRSRSLGSSIAAVSPICGDIVETTSPTSPSPPGPRVSSPLYVRLSDVPMTKRYDSLESLQLDECGPLSPKNYSHEEDELHYEKRISSRTSRDRTNHAEEPSHVVDSPRRKSLSYSRRRDETDNVDRSTTSLPPPLVKLSSSSSSSSYYGSSLGHGDTIIRSHSTSVDGSRDSRQQYLPKESNEEPHEHQIRGDPDGCGLDHMVRCPSTIPEIRVDPLEHHHHHHHHLGEEYINIKKGWLMKLEVTEEWRKRWCVLMGSSFKVYSDTSQEDAGIPNFVVHMNEVLHVEEIEVGRNYGLKIKLADGKYHIFSAVTATFRSNWIYALKNAANTKSQLDHEVPFRLKNTETQKSSTSEDRVSAMRPSTTPSRTVFSSDEELRTLAGERVAVESDSYVTKSGGNGSSQPSVSTSAARTLPPSPPLNRTAISKVKERARLKTNVRVSSKISSRSSRTVTSASGDNAESVDKSEFSGDDCESDVFAEGHSVPSRRLTAIVDSATKEPSRLSNKTNLRLKDKSRRYSLPAKSTTVSSAVTSHMNASSRLSDVQHSPRSSFGKGTRVTRDKYHGDSHCSSIYERDRVIEALESRLQKSEAKLQELRLVIERLSKSRNKATEDSNKNDDYVGDSRCGIDVRIVEDKDGSQQAEVSDLKEALNRANGDLVNVVNKLQVTVEENETLRRLMNVESGKVGADSRKLLSRVNSMSDLANIGEELDVDGIAKEVLTEKYRELRARFEKAVDEIKALRRELKEAYGKCDEMEVACLNQKRCAEAVDNDYRSQLRLMSDRIEDLTSKLTNSEKQLRQHLKLKGGKQESKETRRTRSLKGREALTVSKEVENKVEELEKKLNEVEGFLKAQENAEQFLGVVDSSRDHSDVSRKTSIGSDVSDTKSLHVFVRLNSLESKVSGAVHKIQSLPSINSSPVDEKVMSTDVQVASSFEGDFLNEKEAPVALISELNCQIEELRSRTSELELALLGFRQKVEKCKELLEIVVAGKEDVARKDCLKTLEHHLLDAMTCLEGSHKGNSFETESLFRNFFSKVVVSLEDVIQKKLALINERKSDDIEIHQEKLLLLKASREALLMEIFARCFSVSSSKSLDRQQLLLEDARGLLFLMKRLELKLDESHSGSKLWHSNWLIDARSAANERGTDDYNMSDLNVVDILNELEDVEVTARKLAKSWRDDWVESYVRHVLCEEKGLVAFETDLSESPLILKVKDCFSKSLMTLVEKMGEVDVVRIISNLLCFGCSVPSLEVLSWEQRLSNEKTELIIEGVRREVDEFVRDVQIGFEEAVSHYGEDGNYGDYGFDPLCCMDQEFTDAVVQCTFMFISSSFVKALLRSEDTVDIPEVVDLPMLPRVVGSVMKPDFRESDDSNVRFASHVQELVVNKLKEVESGSSVSVADGCQQCKELQRKVKQMAEKYASDLLLETERHQAKLEALYDEHAETLMATEDNHSKREHKYTQEVQSLQEKLFSLEEDYERQLISLKELFEQELAKRTDIKINKANVQRKYKAEIDQLKNLCEKGLVAMEHSHLRMIAELEEKHRQEMEQLQLEKEQALAEETQATLAALDAMRKAHETELQKEVTRFKEEFLQKMGHSSADLDALHREHKEEMETIKCEILSLSEKYSVKCLECAALEEHVEIVTNQLTEANSLIFDLMARNKQLNTHLIQNMRELMNLAKESDKGSPSNREETMKELKIHLKLKETQLIAKDEEIAELTRKLTSTMNQQNELENHCRILDASVKAGNRSCEDEMGTLRARLENIIMSSSGSSKQADVTEKQRIYSKEKQTTYQLAEPKAKSKIISSGSLRGRELLRSPSCPKLSQTDVENPSFSPKHRQYNRQCKTGSPSHPLVGVVASRKRIFEYQTTKRS